MKISYIICCLFLANAIHFSCGLKTDNTQSNNSQQNNDSDKKATQAVLMTQATPFSIDEKNKISGDYIDQQRVIVPKDLAPQNKWIMFEGPVLENDIIAYRYYADSRHRFDIFGKLVPDLVMDTVSWNYHDIMDWGSDILKVGNSLGLGSPAIYYKDSLYTLSNCVEKTIQVLENGDNKSSIRTTFKGLMIDDNTFDLIQDWSISADKPWSEIHLRILGGKLPAGMYFATGIAKHLSDIKRKEDNTYSYLMNWGTQSFHNEDMGMAIIAGRDFMPEQIENNLSHTFVFKNASQEVKYRFLAVWEKDLNRVKDEESFEDLVMRSQ
jgi:hypothetical protein